ncbi:nitroreductase family protein [Falsirhodobacter sp. 20TX0035]|uniref:nitroreductase family protein n=1 Tax=Falsirhodobacter sp. 20TX0035 TaxID=3022019 RepID=UPI00232F567B|nr:nitroreductase family protein [Falsirhodobacter sp. 20TX0035]MDB6453749.1 nitroreductase family protein [Falsirhodobacter sp. 20TX0035]
MNNPTIQSLRNRRTQYALGKALPLPQDEVDSLVREAVRQSPSSFNSQSSRAVILFGAEHEKLWGIVKDTLRAIVPPESFAGTEAKIDSFAAGAGTVLFFEDQAAIQKLQQDFPLYADAFPRFAEQSGGMAQLAVWTALADAGIGASLQHYSPLIDAAVTKAWDLPESWTLLAQMPFGSNEKPFGDKTFIADADRFRTFG